MLGIRFIHDLALIMVVAGITTVLCHRLRQPVVLGYLVAGMLLGPHTPPLAFVLEEQSLHAIAELGVVLLLFSVGLEFNLRRLRQVGAGPVVAAGTEVMLMLWLGYELGRAFGWRTMDALFLGAIMSLSSTMLVLRSLDDAGRRKEAFGQLVLGILVVEDIFTVVLIALLSGIALTGDVAPGQALTLIGKLALFVVVGLVLGLLAIPRFIDWVAGLGRNETLLVTTLGVCFGASLLAVNAGLSVALGAFISGAIVGESHALPRVEKLIAPLRDMFGALFFVAIGMLIDPRALLQYWLPVLLVSVAVIVGKTLTCTFGGALAGHDGRNALRAGLSLAQIGEFSFVIASLGLSLKVTSDFLYPIAVAVSAVTAFVTPYLVRSSDRIAEAAERRMPRPMRVLLAAYANWIAGLKPVEENAAIAAMLRRLVFHIVINMALVMAVFLGASYLKPQLLELLPESIASDGARRSVLWAAALFLSLPMLIAAYRKADALGMVLAELGIREGAAGARTYALRRVLGKLIPLGALVILALLVTVLGAAILPPGEVLLVLLALAALVSAFLWRSFVQVHARLQAALKETIEKPAEATPH